VKKNTPSDAFDTFNGFFRRKQKTPFEMIASFEKETEHKKY
jgi:hypothetical protein